MLTKATRIGNLPNLAQIVAQIEVQNGATTLRHSLTHGTLTVGRDLSCDLRIEHAFVSARHLMIARDAAEYCVTDLGSTNGSFLNHTRLVPHQRYVLNDGDIIHLDDPAHNDTVSLRFHAGQALLPTKRSPLNKLPMRLGRSDTDILLTHPLVSRSHAQIETQPTGHVLIDLGSTNGTLVNGKRIERYTLQIGDTIQIGVFQLVYQGEYLEMFQPRANMRVVAQNLTQTAGIKTLLHDVTFAVEPCELVALIGASGAGKSTLLGLLSGHHTPDAGQVLIGGLPPTALAAVGYLPQEEPLHRMLTVQRALGYASELRLPPDTSTHEIELRIATTLAEVGLSEQRNLAIYQISGGQRKRVALAAELLADPAVLLLDEPTAALDPGLERRMFTTLRTVADEGRAVIVATHATESIHFCDLVAVLADGRLVYYGPPTEVAAFFGVGSVGEVYEVLSDSQAAEPNAQQIALHWEQQFHNSPYCQQYVAARLQIDAPRHITAPHVPESARTSSIRQFRILVQRGLDVLRSDVRNVAILLLQAPLIGLLLALVAKPDALIGERAAANEAKKVLFMLAVTAIWCGVINAARAIVGERAIWRRERLGGLRLLPYLTAKLVVLMPLLLLQTLALIAAVMVRVALPTSGVLGPFVIEILITTLLAGLAGTALGLAISAMAHTPDRAGSLVPLALIPQILFAGVIFSLGDGLSIQRVLSWLTISRWAMDAYGASANVGILPVLPGMLRPLATPAEYTPTPEHLFTRWLALVGFTLVCMLLAGWRMRKSA